MKSLYHYIHCPYCLRVRMVLGLLNTPYQSEVLPYHDEQTPLGFTGKKMLPIMKWEDESYQNESLDISRQLDSSNLLNWEVLSEHQEILEALLSELGSSIHSLCMPYWIYTKEFDEDSRQYFQTKKEVKKGPFKDLVDQKEVFLEQLDESLKKVESLLTPYYQSEKFTILDIMLASHLWGMYIYPEFQFSEKIHQYLQDIKLKTSFHYHQDLW